jgi:hypothetical protein
MAPVTDKDISELDEWVQARYIRIARDSLPSDASPEEREETIRIAMLQAQSLTWLSGHGAKMIATVAGMTRLVWQSIRREHPDVTEEDLREHMFSPENIEAANIAFKKLNSPSKKGPKAKRNTKRAKARKKKKKARRVAKSTGR